MKSCIGLIIALCVLNVGCNHRVTWQSADYQLSPGDVVTIEVFELATGGGSPHERKLDKDGKITMPVLGEFDALLLTRRELAEEVRSRLIERNILRDPEVTVSLARPDPAAVTVPEPVPVDASKIPADSDELIEQLMEGVDGED